MRVSLDRGSSEIADFYICSGRVVYGERGQFETLFCCFFFYWVSVLHLLHPQVYEEDEQLLSGWDRGSVQ